MRIAPKIKQGGHFYPLSHRERVRVRETLYFEKTMIPLIPTFSLWEKETSDIGTEST